MLEIEAPKRGRGRPPKPKDAHEIWEGEIVKLAELAKRFRQFAGDQLAKLEAEASEVRNIKHRLDILKACAQLVGELTKAAKAITQEVEKEPPIEESGFNLVEFLKEQK